MTKIINKFYKFLRFMYPLSQKNRKANLKYKIFAFTLFEVLIVMTILGIIATIMVSSVKPQEYKEKAMATAAKKVMNEIDHATNMILMNDSLDGTMYNLVATDGTTFSIASSPSLDLSTKLADLYKKYLVTTRKVCNDTTCQCYKHDSAAVRNYSVYFYLKSGACVSFVLNNGNGHTIFPGEKTTVLVFRQGRIRFDVNNTEEPNAFGKDHFVIPLGQTGILWDATPAGGGESVE